MRLHFQPLPIRLALFDFRQTVDYRLEILSGLTVAMALNPEAVAFVLIAGLSPLTGLMQAAAGFLKLGKLMRLVPQPVIFGFVNGLAIIIGDSHIDQFKTDGGAWLHGGELGLFVALTLLSLAIIEVNHFEDPTYKVLTDQT